MNITAATTETYYPNISEVDQNTARTQFPGQVTADLTPASQSEYPPEDSVSRDFGKSEETQEQARNQEPYETAPDGSALTEGELKLIEDLQQVDTEVRQHEMAHMSAGGSLVTSAAQFTYATGPDGQQYAVAGEVGIDTSPIPGDPQATIDKMEQVKQAALAPASPSSQDLKVAAHAKMAIIEAVGELTTLTAKQQAAAGTSQPQESATQAADSYAKVSTLPETDTHTFELAV